MKKVDHAKEIFQDYYKTKSRKDIIDLIVKRVNISPATASTYYSAAKKSLEENSNDETVEVVNKPEVFDAAIVRELRDEFNKTVERFFKKKKLNGTVKATTHSKTKMVIRVDIEGKF